MNHQTYQQKRDEILHNFKKNLDGWIARADNNLPPGNQKGRIIQEIDAEAAQAIDELVNEVIGQDKHSEHKEWDCPCGVTHSFTEEWHATNNLRAEQRAIVKGQP